MKTSISLITAATTICALSLTASAVAESLNQLNPQLLASANLIDNNAEQRYIVKFTSLQQASTLNEEAGLANPTSVMAFSQRVQQVFAQHNIKTLKQLPKLQASVAMLTPLQHKRLLANPNVEYIELDHKRYLMALPSPMAQSTPYGITMVEAHLVSDSSAGNTGVCIIDTGYQSSHADLQSSGVTGYAFSGHGNWYSDGHGHGTHVAGTMVALDNNTGVVGVIGSGQADVHIVKIFNDSGNWTYASDLVAGIQSCQDAGAKVVNMSLGGGSSNQTEKAAMDSFYNSGMLLVAAAGNSGNTSFSYPASYDAVVSVAAVDSNANLASFSQRNSQVEISGPGVSVNSTWNNGGYNSISGTSMASPHVAAVAALVWSNHAQCTAPQIRHALNSTAQDRGASGRDNSYGWGIVKAKAAHDYLTTYGCAGDDGGTPPPSNGATFPNLSAGTGQWLRGNYEIPSGVASITFKITGGSGDADLYVRYGSAPSTNAYTCRPYQYGNEEECTITNPQPGSWHVGIRAYRSFSGLTFSYQY